jgi:hypothetical protein
MGEEKLTVKVLKQTLSTLPDDAILDHWGCDGEWLDVILDDKCLGTIYLGTGELLEGVRQNAKVN